VLTPALADRTAVPTPIVPAELVPAVAKGALTPFVVAVSVAFDGVVLSAFTLFAGAATGGFCAVPFKAVCPLFSVGFVFELFAGGSARLVAVEVDASGRAFNELNASPLDNFGLAVAAPPAAPAPLAFVLLPVCVPIAPLASVEPPTAVAPVLATPFALIPLAAVPLVAAFVGFVFAGF